MEFNRIAIVPEIIFLEAIQMAIPIISEIITRTIQSPIDESSVTGQKL